MLGIRPGFPDADGCRDAGNLFGNAGARKRVMREVQGMLQVLGEIIDAAGDGAMPDQAADRLPLKMQRDLIRAKIFPNSPYSKAVRAEVIRAGWADILPKPEEVAELLPE